MRAPSGLLSLVCIVGLLAAGCSSEVAGSPEVAAVTSSSAAGSAATGADASDAATTKSIESADDSDADLTFPSGDLPANLADLTNLTGIPGFSSGCLAAAGIAMGFGMLMLGPALGGTEVSADDVDEAFANLGDLPPELRDVVDVLHKAAKAATGKSITAAAGILDSPEVTKAMDTLSAYTEKNCGG